ncbi:MAG: hypothetical protein NDJ89_08215 [Oligoflexia bacterium]|nr:hypothetical protein [Oligoflexia bacterium]
MIKLRYFTLPLLLLSFPALADEVTSRYDYNVTTTLIGDPTTDCNRVLEGEKAYMTGVCTSESKVLGRRVVSGCSWGRDYRSGGYQLTVGLQFNCEWIGTTPKQPEKLPPTTTHTFEVTGPMFSGENAADCNFYANANKWQMTSVCKKEKKALGKFVVSKCSWGSTPELTTKVTFKCEEIPGRSDHASVSTNTVKPATSERLATASQSDARRPASGAAAR